jgi:hypothetical protein
MTLDEPRREGRERGKKKREEEEKEAEESSECRHGSDTFLSCFPCVSPLSRLKCLSASLHEEEVEDAEAELLLPNKLKINFVSYRTEKERRGGKERRREREKDRRREGKDKKRRRGRARTLYIRRQGKFANPGVPRIPNVSFSFSSSLYPLLLHKREPD